MRALTTEDVFVAVADRPGVAWLDSSDGDGWSILTWDPVEAVTGEDWVDAARRRLAPSGDRRVPFSGGFVGYVGYEAGHTVDHVPTGRPTPEPPVHLARYEGALCHDHATGAWIASGTPGFRADAERALRGARPAPLPHPPTGSAERTTHRERYEEAVRAVLALIEAGDCYQINLTRPVHVAGAGHPVDAFRRLRRAPAAYGAFLAIDDRLAILSNSPELFLEVRGRAVVSDPIKGTRPRGLDSVDDQRLRHELWKSTKDAAELTMIVDLVRNDLSRVCRPGSVVAQAREVRAHATVLHTHWPVRGELREGEDAIAAVAATFPPGSVTGAPKIRACERIRELEDEPRGVYTGAIGYLADGGDATMSVAIRVAIFDKEDARFHVGGGVVAASDPAAEWEETEVKARALRSALLASSATAPRRR